MFRTTLLAIAPAIAIPAAAMAEDSKFQDYAAYAAFVDTNMKNRDFVPLIQQLGGRDEYTPEQLAATRQQLLVAFPLDFENVTVSRQEDLGGGLSQEARIYWTGLSYAYFYALLHQRDDALVVISFYLNSSAQPVMDRF